MKKTFLLEGLDCANCAAEIERAVAALDDVKSVSVSFITMKMILEADDAVMPEVAKKAVKLAKKVECDVTVKEL